MTLTRDHFSLNTLQWITVSLGDSTGDPGSVGWEFDRPSFALEAEGTGYAFEVPGAEVSVEVIVP